MRRLQIICFILYSGFTFAQNTDTTFKRSGTISGSIFGDYYYKLHSDSSGRGSQQYSNMQVSANAFEFRRVYLGYSYNLSPRFSTEFLLAHEGQMLNDNSRTVFIKAANFRWKNIIKYSDLVVGQQATPSWSLLVEKIWGYRSAEKTILDMRRMGSSNDVGIGLQGLFNRSGNFGYNILIGNGTGPRPEGDVFKKIYGNIYGKILGERLVIDLYGDYERTDLQPYFHKFKATGKISVMFLSEWITIGTEAFLQAQHNYSIYSNPITTITDTTDIDVEGLSFFARGQMIKGKINYFIRYDMFNPDIKFRNDVNYLANAFPNTETFFMVGLDYTPHENVHIMPNIWVNEFSSRINGVSGSTKKDYDLVPRITFWFTYK